jgi:hypothetical protein
MIRLDTRHYRIEECAGTPLRFALDRKEPSERGVCLVNLRWSNCYEHLLAEMAADVLARMVVPL